MKSSNMIRAWRNRDFRDTMKGAVLAKAANPAGIAELDEALLSAIGGATHTASNNGCGSHGGRPIVTTACAICAF